jgi:hypothetical protein
MKMSTATKSKVSKSTTTAEEKVKAEIASMLQINGNTRTAHDWVPRVVMMAYERRCANNPDNSDLAECFSVAQAIASRS